MTATPQPVPFDAGRWHWTAAEARIEDHLGRRSLYLKGGIATADGVRCANGWMEFDIAFTGARGFVGGAWRVLDAQNFEEFYLRPHQSGNPDANQYTPVFHGIRGWQLYHGKRYCVPVPYRFNAWIHVKILFAGAQAEIYVDDMEKPALFIDRLQRPVEPGGVGVSALDFAPAHFSDFSFVETDTPPIQGTPGAPETPAPGVVASWSVSDTFRESEIEGRLTLGPDDLAARRWTRLAVEPSGLANLARVQGIRERNDTVFARTTVRSSHEQVKRLDVGFSDRVRVYLNGRLLFRGDDTAFSRDYRFLGSIGYYDALYLPLREGENEILVAVTEDPRSLGGWGIQARVEDLAGLTLGD
ncbi:MAG TPA: hypothetical protein DD490_22265 [Acidobacteria bacterium]|nr:hypothetical protein [Acidobacteriota bacterium]